MVIESDQKVGFIVLTILTIFIGVLIFNIASPKSISITEIIPVSISGYKIMDSCFNIFEADTRADLVKLEYCKTNNITCMAQISTYHFLKPPTISEVTIINSQPSSSCVKV